jgi:hypothetical protein
VANRRRRSGSDVHTEVLEVLLDKVRNDPYPSTTHLDMLEAMLEDDEVDQYAEALLDKVRDEAFPSLDHLRRLQSLA